MSEPRTRAEETNYAETSTYADVVAFLDALRDAGRIALTTIGTTGEGRAIPLAIASTPRVATPAEARALGRPVVYVQANIHAGEVEGKEAMLALLRDLTASRAPILERVVLVVTPIYNADGNERFASQAVNRREQNGPERVGTRANAAGLDLNRDYIKAEAPETRASLAALAAWNPDLFVDLHTTNGSYHGYALTYAPSLDPSAAIPRAFATGTLLPATRERMARRGFATFDYGNFSLAEDDDLLAFPKRGWWSYDHRPRFGTNYLGLRGRLSVLSEAYSHDPFERRIAATRAFVEELLAVVDEHRVEVLDVGRRADAAVAAGDASVALRSAITTTPFAGPVAVERLERVPGGAITEPGVPPRIRRTGRFETETLPVYDRFVASDAVRVPRAYLLPDLPQLVERLRVHGILARRVETPLPARIARFTVGVVDRAERTFQQHHETSLHGTWSEHDETIRPGAWLVDARTPLGLLAARLLEPESDDGFVTWEAFDVSTLHVGAEFPVARVI